MSVSGKTLMMPPTKARLKPTSPEVHTPLMGELIVDHIREHVAGSNAGTDRQRDENAAELIEVVRITSPKAVHRTTSRATTLT